MSREEHRLAACQGKQAFDGKPMADRIARKMKEGAVAFRCPFCRKWHIEHRGKR